MVVRQMDYAQLLQQVQAAAALDRAAAEHVSLATVATLAERMGVEPQAAWTHVRAVLGTLEREVAEMDEVRQRLPRDFDALMA